MERNTSGLRPQPPAWSDEALCRLIWECRQKDGACTLGNLVKATGQSKQALANRMRTLQRRGLVHWTPAVHGSLRTTDETVYRKKAK